MIEERSGRRRQRRAAIPDRDLTALGAAILFVALGLVAIYVVVQVAEVEDGAVLAALLIVPAVLYLLLSGRVSESKGPAGLEVRVSEVANQVTEDGYIRGIVERERLANALLLTLVDAAS